MATDQRKRSLTDDMVKHPNQNKKKPKWLDAAKLFCDYKNKWENLGLD
jgi:hypothetical protein